MTEKAFELKVSMEEAAFLVEALHDAIIRRIHWSISPDFDEWRKGVPIEIIQGVINSMVGMYGVSLQALKEKSELPDSYVASMSFQPMFWDLINDVTLAKEWHDLPFHNPHENSCVICQTIEEA